MDCKIPIRCKVNTLTKIVKNPGKYKKHLKQRILVNEYLIYRIPTSNFCAKSEEFVEIYETQNMGEGLRAKIDLKWGQPIGCYYGEIKDKLEDTSDWRYNYEYALKGLYVDGKGKSLMAKMNHSNKPNVYVFYELHKINDIEEMHISFITNKLVKKGEELFIDYGPEYWDYAQKIGLKPFLKQKLITDYFSRFRVQDDD